MSDPRFAASTSRRPIWQDFSDFISTIEPFGIMQSVWLSGSFLTSKIDPGDLDMTFLLDALAMGKLTAAGSPHLALALEAVKKIPTLDVYYIEWVREDEAHPASVDVYRAQRGYWDDWWQRDRDARDRTEANHGPIPKRGYLEVKLNDYS